MPGRAQASETDRLAPFWRLLCVYELFSACIKKINLVAGSTPFGSAASVSLRALCRAVSGTPCQVPETARYVSAKPLLLDTEMLETSSWGEHLQMLETSSWIIN